MKTHYRYAQGGFSILGFLGVIALAMAAFMMGRFYGNGALVEENHKLKESVRMLRAEKLGIGTVESVATPRPETQDTPESTRISAAPPAEPQTPPAVAPPAPIAASVPETPPATETPAEPPIPVSGKKTSKSWVADFGDGTQGTATYWRCNNATLAANGMEYYAYGWIPANHLKSPADAYSVKDGKAIIISGCWSPRLNKAILYRKSNGKRWEPTVKLDDGSWTLVVN